MFKVNDKQKRGRKKQNKVIQETKEDLKYERDLYMRKMAYWLLYYFIALL